MTPEFARRQPVVVSLFYADVRYVRRRPSFSASCPNQCGTPCATLWYRPKEVAKIVDLLEPPYVEPETQVSFAAPSRAKEELIAKLLSRELPTAVLGDGDPIQSEGPARRGDAPEPTFERAMRRLVRREAQRLSRAQPACAVRRSSSAPSSVRLSSLSGCAPEKRATIDQEANSLVSISRSSMMRNSE